MFLADYTLPDEIFIDANIWSYFALRNPDFQDDCTRFLERVEQRALHGVTSNFVLNEVVHVILIGKGSEILQTCRLGATKPAPISWTTLTSCSQKDCA